MTIFVDQTQDYGTKYDWCHMWSDDCDEELHIMARKIGLKRSWFQEQNPRFHHYDLRQNKNTTRETKREKAIMNGAVEMSLRDWCRIHLAAHI